MQMEIIWSSVLTAALGLLVWTVRNYIEEQKRLQILLNRTREEMAKEYVTKAEVNHDMSRLMDRLEKLDEKLDKLFEVK